MTKSAIHSWLKERRVQGEDGAILELVREVISLRKRLDELERNRAPEPQTFGERFRALVGI